MQKAAAELNFEAAAELRDKMIKLKESMYEETRKAVRIEQWQQRNGNI